MLVLFRRRNFTNEELLLWSGFHLSVVKPKPKYSVITPTNYKNVNNTMNQSEFKVNACNRRQARRKLVRARHDWLSGLASYWLKMWCEFCQPITERSKAKPKQTYNYFRHSTENRSTCNKFCYTLVKKITRKAISIGNRTEKFRFSIYVRVLATIFQDQ